ncbi:hypothetical protein ABT373_27590 [Streptomyces sp. NPDC000070]|uniref:hypothetical protein n=1 Tax=Streptomyces sp. NPDC000070 TaxID=3154240 RepID=UPI00331D262E
MPPRAALPRSPGSGRQLLAEGPTGPAAKLLGGLPVEGLPTHGLPVNGVPVG